jgi:hypothetical protein
MYKKIKKGIIMIIISIIGFILAIGIILYYCYPFIKNFSSYKITVNEDNIKKISEIRNKDYNLLLLLREKFKLISHEKKNYHYTVKLLENFYKEKEQNYLNYMNNKYKKESDINQKKLTIKLTSEMFEQDIKEVFQNYHCNSQELEKNLDNFFKDK